MTNTWIHHLEIVLSTMVVAILVLVCCTKTTNRSAPLLLVANVGPPRNSVNMVRGGGMLTKQGSVPMINRQRLDACLRRFQIQSWSAFWLSLLHSSARLGGVSILEDTHRLASVVVHNRRWSDEAWTSKRSSRARVGVRVSNVLSPPLGICAWSSSGLKTGRGPPYPPGDNLYSYLSNQPQTNCKGKILQLRRG